MKCQGHDSFVLVLCVLLAGITGCSSDEREQGKAGDSPSLKKWHGINFHQDDDLWIGCAGDTVLVLEDLSLMNCRQVWPVGHSSDIGVEIIVTNDYCGVDISNVAFMSSTLKRIDTLSGGEIIWTFQQEIGSSHTKHVEHRQLKYSSLVGIVSVNRNSEDWPY